MYSINESIHLDTFCTGWRENKVWPLSNRHHHTTNYAFIMHAMRTNIHIPTVRVILLELSFGILNLMIAALLCSFKKAQKTL